MSKLSYGVVELTLGNDTYEMKVTSDALDKLDSRFGGLTGAVECARNMNREGYAYIICAAANLGQKMMPEIKEKILAVGIVDVMPVITDYLIKCSNPTGATDDEVEEQENSEKKKK